MTKNNKITFSSDKGKLSLKDHVGAAKMLEEYFKSENDVEQAPISKENIIWVHKNMPNCANVIKYDNKIIGSTFVVPCNRKLMEKFLSGKINENQLFEMIKKELNLSNFDSIYLASAFIKQEFRGRGLAVKGFVKSIKKLIGNKKVKPTLFYWGYSVEGKKLARKVAEITGLELKETK